MQQEFKLITHAYARRKGSSLSRCLGIDVYFGQKSIAELTVLVMSSADRSGKSM